jgi:hypothetical protein
MSCLRMISIARWAGPAFADNRGLLPAADGENPDKPPKTAGFIPVSAVALATRCRGCDSVELAGITFSNQWHDSGTRLDRECSACGRKAMERAPCLIRLSLRNAPHVAPASSSVLTPPSGRRKTLTLSTPRNAQSASGSSTRRNAPWCAPSLTPAYHWWQRHRNQFSLCLNELVQRKRPARGALQPYRRGHIPTVGVTGIGLGEA